MEIADKVWRRAEMKLKLKAAFLAVLSTQRLWRLLELKSRENFAEEREVAVRAAVADMRAFLECKRGFSPRKRKNRCAASPVSDAGSSKTHFGSPPATQTARRRDPPTKTASIKPASARMKNSAWIARHARDERIVRRIIGLE